MMTPGSNLLSEAFDSLETIDILYYKYKDRSLNAARQYITTYEDAITIEASVQAVNRQTYNELGLDFQKKYLNFFLCLDVIDLARDVSGDKVEVFGKTFQLESSTSWYPIDGWVEVLGVQID